MAEYDEKLLLAMCLASVDKVTHISPHPCCVLEEIGPWCGGGEEKIRGSGWC